jgi:hypothetical protein
MRTRRNRKRRAAAPPDVPASQHKQARSWDSKNGQSGKRRCSWLNDEPHFGIFLARRERNGGQASFDVF